MDRGRKFLRRAGGVAGVVALSASVLAGKAPPPEPPAAPAATAAPGAMAAPTANTAAWKPAVPRTWDDAALATLEVPLAHSHVVPRQVPAEYYYRIPVRTLRKGYPVYHPDREPAGYLEMLKSREPEVVFDPAKLVTQEDWVRAGELVFNAPIVYDALLSVDKLHDRDWYRKTGVPVAADGTVPFLRYYVLAKGQVAVGEFSCATCHVRVMPDGSTVIGAQGNYPLGRLDALDHREQAAAAKDPTKFLQEFRDGFRAPYGAPWLGANDPAARYAKLSAEQIAAGDEAVPPGVQARLGTSAFHPVQVPDLIGLKDRLYFDRTGNVRHRSIGDLMRYAALNQGMSFFTVYGDFRPAGSLPEPQQMRRYSDEQLYALGLFLYSLQPPPNPNQPDALSARGQEIFTKKGCGHCHTPPLYTNNKLIAVDGFKPPTNHPETQDVLFFRMGTDPGLALYTRRGTGFYKVPSLKGLWYRGPLEHSGSVATLEDWFDPRRLQRDYVPTGFRGAGVKTRAVPGHRYGLDLAEPDRKALIAFLRTL
ncbi:MAG TPA: hypothetical protein VKY89_22285 [Thermoanaerobaculia bacterium]|nr:hypothetical protein [Thermoanaerobaculia bacterium]